MAVVAECDSGRVYLPPNDALEYPSLDESNVARIAEARQGFLGSTTPTRAMITGGVCSAYGLATWGHLFTDRQLVALTTFSDLVQEVRGRIRADALAEGGEDDGTALSEGGSGASAYADAVSVYLAFACSRMADRHSSLARWDPNPSGFAPKIANTFSRQALPMVWDFAEGNPFSSSSGNFGDAVEWITKVLERFPASPLGFARQQDAAQLKPDNRGALVISTDPPYYNNIAYADLSDYFYVWLRRSLRGVFPDLFATVVVPKAEELVATAHRHGGKEQAEAFFLEGMTRVMRSLAESAHPSYPLTIYYAFKQTESSGRDGTSSTGWETFLEAVLRAGLSISGTWPMRTELSNRMVSSGANALASSVVLVCRPRAQHAPVISRRQFAAELRTVLPAALDAMTRGAEDWGAPVAPVDLSQAIIGPGMEVFSRYGAVLEADGTRMSVRTALTLINRFLAEDDFDADTQFCLAWFEQHGWKSGEFGSANVLAQAKGTAVDAVRAAGVLESGGGDVRLLRPSEYADGWDPSSDDRLPVWEVLHRLIGAFRAGGEEAAGALLGAVQAKAEPARQLAYRLYTLCERAGWAEDARTYNDLITSWPAIEATAQRAPALQAQPNLFDA